MANKFWIAFFAFGAFLFFGVTIGGIWISFANHEPIRRVIIPICGMSLATLQIIKVTISRAKYGPNGPPSDPLENFHIDF